VAPEPVPGYPEKAGRSGCSRLAGAPWMQAFISGIIELVLETR